MNNSANRKSAPASGRQYLSALSEPTRVREECRAISVTITTRERDREGDLVEPSGLDFEHYLKNPVVLWAHDLTRAPVGRVLSISVLPERVDAEVQFADTVEGRECFQLYRDRYLNAWSIGFLPRRWEPLAEGGFHIQEAEVVELSAVPVPANRGSLTRALGDGLLALSPAMLAELANAAGSARGGAYSPTFSADADGETGVYAEYDVAAGGPDSSAIGAAAAASGARNTSLEPGCSPLSPLVLAHLDSKAIEATPPHTDKIERRSLGAELVADLFANEFDLSRAADAAGEVVFRLVRDELARAAAAARGRLS